MSFYWHSIELQLFIQPMMNGAFTYHTQLLPLVLTHRPFTSALLLLYILHLCVVWSSSPHVGYLVNAYEL